MAEVPVQPQSSSKGINWKTILIGTVIGGLVIGIGALGFYLIQGQSDDTTSTQVTTPKTATDSAKQTTPSAEKDETANWKIFTKTYPANTEVISSVSFKYPTDWVLFELRSEIQNPALAKFQGEKETVDSNEAKISYNGITSTKNFSPKPTSLKEFIEVSNGMPTAKKTKLQVSGKEAYLVEGEFVRLLYVDLGNAENILYISLQGKPVKDFEKIFDSVIPTIEVK